MPAFHRHPAEAASRGRLLAGYGEIEYGLAVCLGQTLSDHHSGLRTYFRLRSESSRIDTADALMRGPLGAIDLAGPWSESLGAIRWCLRIRNGFAHCHWADHHGYPGLFFTNLQDAADAAETFKEKYFHVDVAALELMEDFYGYTIELLDYTRQQHAIRTGLSRHHPFPRPTKLARPSLHNPPEEHIPPWLT